MGGRARLSYCSKISDFFNLIFVWGLLPKIWGPLPDFGEHSPFPETRPSRNMFSTYRVKRRYLVLVVLFCFFCFFELDYSSRQRGRLRQLRAPSLLDSSGLVLLLLPPAPSQAGRDCSALCVLFSHSLMCALLRGRRWQSSVFRLMTLFCFFSAIDYNSRHRKRTRQLRAPSLLDSSGFVPHMYTAVYMLAPDAAVFDTFPPKNNHGFSVGS